MRRDGSREEIHPASELGLVWEPLEIGSTRVKNRIMMTAQTTLYRQGQHSRATGTSTITGSAPGVGRRSSSASSRPRIG